MTANTKLTSLLITTAIICNSSLFLFNSRVTADTVQQESNQVEPTPAVNPDDSSTTPASNTETPETSEETELTDTDEETRNTGKVTAPVVNEDTLDPGLNVETPEQVEEEPLTPAEVEPKEPQVK